MLTYRPEGLQSLPIPTPESLRRAGGSREIFQAMCIKCDEFHNLVVGSGQPSGAHSPGGNGHGHRRR